VSVYDLDSLGWLLYERLATDAVERELAVPASAWQGSSDELREALWDGTVLRMVWSRGQDSWPAGADVIVTNADEAQAPDGVRVLGRRWLSEALDRSGELRAAHPSALGGSALSAKRTSFDADAARELARVFVPVAAHARALTVLRRHRFAVLTGPPEMGKTAVARMVALALVTDGWEAHECTRPEDVWSAWADDRPQVFVADDAFGSTEYRPDSAERWAREMERLLRSLDERHALIWTSRPAPLRAGLARIHRERGAERFPQPAAVLVDAAALDRAEKALILFRHAKAVGASGTAAAQLVRAHGDAIVENPHFTPERIRRFASGRLFRLEAAPGAHAAVDAILQHELREPTEAMAASFAALDREHRAVLVAMLDCGSALVAERELAAAARRHADHGLPRAPAELMDRLADHFLRVTDTSVAWVHPSWRDLVIDQLTGDAGARRAFLARAGIEGLLLGISTAGGQYGEREFPLLVDDADWDTLGDRLTTLVREADDHDTQRVLLAIDAAFDAACLAPTRAELRSVAQAVLAAVRRRWDRAHEPVPVAPLVAWLQVAAWTGEDSIPHLERTWFAVLPPAEGRLSDDELRMADDWLWLVQVLYDLRPEELEPLGFPTAHQSRLQALAAACTRERLEPLAGAVEDDGRPLAASIRRRLLALRVLASDPAPEASAPAEEPAEAAGEPDAAWAGDSTVARILRDL
jgi:hypothetical protein